MFEPRGRWARRRAPARGGGERLDRGGGGDRAASASARGERKLGFGERSDRVDQRGNEVENYVGEGPYPATEYPIIAATVPPWGSTSAGRHLLPDAVAALEPRLRRARRRHAETSRFQLARPSATTGASRSTPTAMSLRVLAGPSVGRRAAAPDRVTGRQPKPKARGCSAPGSRPGTPTGPRRAGPRRRLRDADAPVSVVETHMRYMPCGADVGREASERARTAAFHAQGLAATDLHARGGLRRGPLAFDDGVARGAFLAQGRRHDAYTYEAFVGGAPRRSPRSTSPARPASRSTRRCWPRLRRRLRRLDGGLRRVHAAGLGRRRRHDRAASCHNLTRSSTTAPASASPTRRSGRSCASSAPAGPACTPTRRSSGAATRRPAGASTACARR